MKITRQISQWRKFNSVKYHYKVNNLMSKSIIMTILITVGLLSVGFSYAITPINDEASVTTADKTTSPILQLAQTGAIAWHNKLESNTGDYIIGIEGGQDAIHINRLGISIKDVSMTSDVFVNKNSPKLSILALDSSTSPILQFGQAGAIGWNYYLEPGLGNLIIGVDEGQDAIILDRVGIGIEAIKFPNGNVGIGTTPSEKLDVDGNIRLTSNIVSPNDICIGNCP